MNGVDRVLREAASRGGRRPAVEVTPTGSVRQSDTVLMRLSGLVAPVPQAGHCLGGG
ncbi:hypothetical protein AB0L59_08110 [Streptomyces sp. NPDC052109]|uniref:hypothetical protein n=1 Tax=Streptomyces sp. NPDC052109 TaxID=3155527 RepID=UPI00342980BE